VMAVSASGGRPVPAEGHSICTSSI
jgi:hypothetical protein